MEGLTDGSALPQGLLRGLQCRYGRSVILLGVAFVKDKRVVLIRRSFCFHVLPLYKEPVLFAPAAEQRYVHDAFMCLLPALDRLTCQTPFDSQGSLWTVNCQPS